MNWPFSPDTQAVLLLTAPMIVSKNSEAADLLKPKEFRALEEHLRNRSGRHPANLLNCDPAEILGEHPPGGLDRIRHLLGRSGQLAQAVDQWGTRDIWVISHNDEGYPQRFKKRMPGTAPLLLYGCGDRSLLEQGGLAVVGPRDADEDALEFARRVGALTAKCDNTLVSGAARGVDRIAMAGAMKAGGRSVGVIANGLEKLIMTRDCRDRIIDEQLLMVSPYDPRAGFHRGGLFARNTLIYNLADAALVVEADPERGGTRAGALQQLRANCKHPHRSVPVYVRATSSEGLAALKKEGAHIWPDPETEEGLRPLLDSQPTNSAATSRPEGNNNEQQRFDVDPEQKANR